MNFNDIEKIRIPEGEVRLIVDNNDDIIYEKITTGTPLFFHNITESPIEVRIKKEKEDEPTVGLEISNDGRTWYNWGNVTTEYLRTTIQSKERVYIRATEDRGYLTTGGNNHTFSTTGRVYVGGNILSLGYKNFEKNTTISSQYAYSSVFQEDRNITRLNILLPTGSLAWGSYSSMFSGCESLTQAPKLPAYSINGYTYNYMFYNCKSLTKAPILSATRMYNYSYHFMFGNCTSLTETPDLPAATLASGCYNSMFQGCTSLQKTGIIEATGSISSYASRMFYNCTSLQEMTWTSTTPPTISSNIWTGCPADMIIYVPDASVEDYKAASVWNSRAAYIKGISEKQ